MGAAASSPEGGSGGQKAPSSSSSPSPPRLPAALVVCGPSGVGKGTLIKHLVEKYEGKFGFSCSHTTRAPREVEQVRVFGLGGISAARNCE